MNINRKCDWCGNTSGRMDRRGMCISCGGNLTVMESKPNTSWDGTSGSSYNLSIEAIRPNWVFKKEWLQDWGELEKHE